ncbi:hypothetical protein [Alterisphingorhabdus coralli]|uniref:Uncharacterized protein n=1 Tax=Alterisphingorhabdus coralli TaxID=3071408 RepID=A0AA97F6J9_9SPHN|nr:hypothetical protein [Parasphingorhabdus sp. SCSIO 66989]WOE74037.1 hypothetical protein RB602_09200 [Parasphingorhabdus sp. SCSIO 66989]
MPLLLGLGQQESIAFGMLELLIEHGLRKYCAARLEHGILQPYGTHSVLSKIANWLDPESADYRYDFISFDELDTDEVKFIHQLMCDFWEEGTSIDGQVYDHPLNDIQNQQLSAAIPAIRNYLDARLSGADAEKSS